MESRAGPYVLCAPIAAGGFGRVYIARKGGAPGFSRLFAIKVLHEAKSADREAVAMLLDEARITSRITHPNVAPVVDVVEDGGQFYLVMDYVEGETLAKLVARARDTASPIPIPIAVALTGGLLRGLHAAHEAVDHGGRPLSIVHRDVSPHNVIVSVHGVPKVLDFGIAKAARRMTVTRTGEVKGKLAYMSPEQLDTGDVDRRADLYSVAVILWELVAGRRLHDAKTPEEALRGVGADELSDLPRASDPLKAIIAANLSRSPAQRHATAAEMGDALEQCGAIATDREIAAWLVTLAGDSLAERRRVVESIGEIEEDGSQRPPDFAPISSDATASALEVGIPSPSPDPPAPSPATAASRPRRMTGAIAFASAVSIGAVLGALVLAAPPAPTPSRAPSSPPSAGAEAKSPAPEPSASEPHVALSAPSLVAPTAALASESSAPSSEPARAAVNHLPHSAVPSTRQPDCATTYSFNAQGVKVLRAECMH